jgi:hypothetical protein
MFKRLKKSFKRAYVRSIRARELRAAEELAHYLVSTNEDFRRFSKADLAKAIASKKSIKWSEISL